MTDARTYGPDDWITLDEAARVAFPDGTVTVHVLRTQRDRRALDTWKLGRREYTTLAAVERMRQCLAAKSPPDSGSSKGPAESPPTSSSTEDGKSAQAAALASVNRLRKSLRATSRKGASGPPAEVIPLRSGSPTC